MPKTPVADVPRASFVYEVIINLAGRHLVRRSLKTKKDQKGRVPVWDLTDECWRLVKQKWLREASKEEVRDVAFNRREALIREKGRREAADGDDDD